MKIRFKRVWFKRLLYTFFIVFFLVLTFWCSVYFGLWGVLPDQDELRDIRQAEASVLLDTNEKLYGKYFIFDRQLIQFDQLPKHLVDALIATEDVRFYEHNGVDYRSLLRVFFKSILLQNTSSGGGSTISQQLAKNLYPRQDHGWFSMPVNKLKEMIIAHRFEKVYTKQDIIVLYLNTVPFSENVFGVESAAQRFFSAETSDLDLSQAATLIGTLKAPHSYNPRLFPERSQFRRDVVLQQMEKYDYLDSILRLETSEIPLKVRYQKFDHKAGKAPYMREKIRREVLVILDSINAKDDSEFNLYTSGLKIHTTLDIDMQTYAERAMKMHMKRLQKQHETSYGSNAPWLTNMALIDSHLKDLKIYKQLKSQNLNESQLIDSLNKKAPRRLFTWEGDLVKELSVIDSLKHTMKFLNSGFVAVDPYNGAIKAYVGGIDFDYFQFDHVSDARRQVGSTFKPIVYTAALEEGIPPCTYYSLKEVTYSNQNDWTPTNNSRIEPDRHLNYSMEKALSESVNTIAVKVLEDTGIERVIDQARQMGIRSKLPKVPSLALGTAELSMLEMASAYTSYVNNGVNSTPFYITKIEDKSGQVIYEHRDIIKSSIAISEDTRQSMIQMMKSTVNSGTAIRIRSTYKLANDIAAKTGTTQDNKDGWFVALSPKLVMLSWVGHDDHRIGFKNTTIGQGANSALPIVAEFLKALNQDQDYDTLTKAQFESPSESVLDALDCEPQERDGFLKRLFTRDKKKRDFDTDETSEDRKERRGIFGIFKKKDNKKNSN